MLIIYILLNSIEEYYFNLIDINPAILENYLKLYY